MQKLFGAMRGWEVLWDGRCLSKEVGAGSRRGAMSIIIIWAFALVAPFIVA
jgi:hypothetical protein